MTKTALIAEVPESEEIVCDLRLKYDGVSRQGMPSHITVLYPFLEPIDIDKVVSRKLKDVFLRFDKFSFKLGKIGMFPETVYLSPEPEQRFIDITNGVVKVFPRCLPFGGIHDTIIPHLSVLNGDSSKRKEVASELEKRIDSSHFEMTAPEESIRFSNSLATSFRLLESPFRTERCGIMVS